VAATSNSTSANDRPVSTDAVDLRGAGRAGQRAVSAAWSDDKKFTQGLTSFTLDSGKSIAFQADMPLEDRNGQQLSGTYPARAFLTTSGPQPRVEATTPINVTLAP
jgi:hypothetical protein